MRMEHNQKSARTRRELIRELLTAGMGTSALLGVRPGISLGAGSEVVEARQFDVPRVDSDGVVVSKYRASTRYFVENLGDGALLEMALIPGGEFEMGSNVSHPAFELSEKPMHRVRIRPFAIAVFPVTRLQWRQVANTLPRIKNDMYSYWGTASGLDLPVDAAPLASIQEFLGRLQGFTKRNYRYPSEAEWEYACRAGTTTTYHFGEGIGRAVANYGDGNPPRSEPVPVGSKNAANRFGLHDMHGAVMERCEDLINFSYVGAPTDGSAWQTSPYPYPYQIARGGCFLFGAPHITSARRHFHGDQLVAGLGFRLALSLDHGFMDPVVDGGAKRQMNAASQLLGSIAPGEILVLKGNAFTSSAEMVSAPPEFVKALVELNGVRVRIANIACVVIAVSASEIRIVAPYELVGSSEVEVIVDAQGQSSMPVVATVAESVPGLFTADQSGRGVVAAINEDGSAHSEGNPAARGSRLSLFGTGEGQTNPAGVNGRIANPSDGPMPVPVLPVTVRIGGVECEILYAGGEGGQVAGLFRVDVQVPAGLEKSGLWPVVLQVGESLSQDEAFVAVS